MGGGISAGFFKAQWLCLGQKKSGGGRKNQLMKRLGDGQDHGVPENVPRVGCEQWRRVTLGVALLKALGSLSRKLGASADMMLWRSRFPHKQHPVVPKQPSLIFTVC